MQRRFYPTNYVSIEDITGRRPDLAQISESEVENIADKVGELISESYWDALDILLQEKYPVIENGDTDETE